MAITAIFCVLVAVAAIALFWTSIRDQYGPWGQHESQCLICQRNRIEKWVSGAKAVDSISTNEYSTWIDSFEPSDHQHVWLVHTNSGRRSWFGLRWIGCGGVNVISTIYWQRAVLGETKAQQAVLAFHRLVRSPRFEKGQLRPMDEFLENLSRDPDFWPEAIE